LRTLDIYEGTLQVGEVARVKDLNSAVVLSVERRHRGRTPGIPASLGELNQRPRWYIWIGPVAGFGKALGNALLKVRGAGTEPGATTNVSILKRPIKFGAADAAAVSLDVTLIPGHPEGSVGLLDHEEIKVGIWRESGHPHIHDLNRPARGDADSAGASGTQAGTAFSAGERTRSNANLLSPPLACACGTNPANATAQSTAILTVDEVHFVCTLFIMSSPFFSPLVDQVVTCIEQIAAS
jgi:hypothetical protein